VENISAVIITHNEAKHIRRCLESLTWLPEVFVIDSGSTDSTRDIARCFANVKIVPTHWQGYAKTKMLGVEKAQHEWILWVDADEVISEQMRTEIQNLPAESTNIAAYAFPRRTYFLGKWIRHGGWYPDYCTRLFHRQRAKIADIEVHEFVETKAEYSTKKLSNAIEHFSFPTVDSYFDKNRRYAWQSSLRLVKKPRVVRLVQMFFHPPFTFVRSYFFRLGFLDGIRGFVVAMGSCFFSFMKWSYAYFEIPTRSNEAERNIKSKT